jgi:hypothetical protein
MAGSEHGPILAFISGTTGKIKRKEKSWVKTGGATVEAGTRHLSDTRPEPT